jgi:S-DNA-T family DNA segregation ATPase FtsK/SpoIIIE
MAAKTKAQPSNQPRDRGERGGRRREILGIFLLALGVFSGLSLVSSHLGDSHMMGPGGSAAAAALYAALGLASYLVVAGSLVAAWRAFRAEPLVAGILEGLGALCLLASVTVLLHLPFAPSLGDVRAHAAGGHAHGARALLESGPGGLVGQWLAEVTASFIGTVGAALAATALLFATMILLTDLRLREVGLVIAWAARSVGGALWAGARALGRLVVAMFPRRDASEHGPAGASAELLLEGGEGDAGLDGGGRRSRRRLGPGERDPASLAIPSELEGDPSDAVRVGQSRAADGRPRGDQRRGAGPANDMSAVLAEVAAAERAPEARSRSVAGWLPSPRARAAAAGADEADFDGRLGAAEVDGGFDGDGELGDGADLDGDEADPMAQADAAASIWSGTAPPVARRTPARASARAGGGQDPGDVPADALVIGEEPASVGAEAGALAQAAAAGPIIVEPAWRTRLRERQGQAAQAARADADHAEHQAAADEQRQQAQQARPTFIKLKDGAYKLPSTELLEYLPPQATDTDKQGLYEMAERLEQAMSNYGVRGKVREIHMGPVVTMFEFAPAPGTRTGKIANLEKDLAMALEAQAVRIVAPIPGKAVVGVEVPNQAREMVYLREILEDDCFTKANSKLQVALGKDIKGAPVSVNLAKMPHLLVAGTTGSGKSVAVNSMIVSLLYNASPEEVRFIMVDPKMLELSIYEGIPHLLLPVVTDPKKANLALRWAVDEMERRYEMLAKAGVRDLAGFNAKVEAELGAKQARMTPPPPGDAGGVVGEPLDPDEVSGQAAAAQAERQAAADQAGGDDPASAAAPPPLQKLPYIVIVIDEFADLMMVAPKDVETSVARIAQKARAAGLHLILATQRPSVDVITGLIKANFPSRIALQVASRIDSRTILDQPGADTLLGNGDMLFSDRGLKLRRVHGAFLGDAEVHRIVDHLKTQAKPVYDLDILKPRDEDAEEGGAPPEDFSDALYDQAVAIVCETRQASVSYIQRRLQIGYNRSARLVEQMERDGIVGPANGAKPREVLAPAGEYLQHAG